MKKQERLINKFKRLIRQAIVAKMLGRNSIGIEKEKKYYDIIQKRLNQTQKKIEEFVVA